MTIVEHIVELRQRLLRSVCMVAVLSIVALIFAKPLFRILQQPMLLVLPEGNSFIATTPFEAYVIYFKTALLAGVIAASPYIFYHFLSFVTPALNPQEKRLVIPMSMAAALLFCGGALFGYFVVFPLGFYYINLVLLDTSIQLMPRMSDYFSVATTLLLVFGLSFDLPVVMFFLGRLGVIDYPRIKQFRRYVMVAAVIIAAMLTPGPDVLSQLLLAGPLWLLYELGGLLIWFLPKKEIETEVITSTSP